MISFILAHRRVNIGFKHRRAVREFLHCWPVVAFILVHERVNCDFEYLLGITLPGKGFRHLTSTLVITTKSFKTKQPINRFQCPLFASTAKPIIIDWSFLPCFPRLRQINNPSNNLLAALEGLVTKIHKHKQQPITTGSASITHRGEVRLASLGSFLVQFRTLASLLAGPLCYGVCCWRYMLVLRRYGAHGSVPQGADPASNHTYYVYLGVTFVSNIVYFSLLPCHLGFHLASAQRLIPCTPEWELLALCFILTNMVWGS